MYHGVPWCVIYNALVLNIINFKPFSHFLSVKCVNTYIFLWIKCTNLRISIRLLALQHPSHTPGLPVLLVNSPVPEANIANGVKAAERKLAYFLSFNPISLSPLTADPKSYILIRRFWVNAFTIKSSTWVWKCTVLGLKMNRMKPKLVRHINHVVI